jgi:hypothetical protein
MIAVMIPIKLDQFSRPMPGIMLVEVGEGAEEEEKDVEAELPKAIKVVVPA